MKYRGNIDLQGNSILGLLPEDIPPLDASILESGIISAARLSGFYGISITGSAGSAGSSTTAVKLQTARTIAGTAFDGTADINISYTNLINVPTAFPTYLGSLSGDLNSLTSGDGWYHQSVNGSATLALNYPVTKAGKLEVRSPSAMYTYQTYHVYDGSGVYQRAYYNSAWSTWQRMFDAGNFTASDVPNLDAAKIVSGVFPSTRLSGTYSISITGTASTATTLATSRTISLTGDATGSVSFDGSANAPIAVTLANSGVTAGQYSKVTVDAKGRVTAGSQITGSDITSLPWSKITNTPTTLSGYGITDAQPLSSELTGLAGLTSEGPFAGLVTRTDANTYTIRSIMPGQGISIDNGEGATDNIFVSNTGVLSITGTTDQVNVVRVGGTVYLSTPQSIATTSSPSFTQVTVSGDPTAATQVATKQYVDTVASGIRPKGSVRAASTANLSLSGTTAVDGVSIVAGDLVLAKNQTAQAQNGVYVVASGAWTRWTSMNTWSSLVSAMMLVEEGTTNADTGWVCTVDQDGTIGSTAITWVQFFGAGTVTAGPGISVTGTQVSLAPSGVTAGAYAKVNVDTYGRVTSGATLVASDIPNLDAAKITSGTLASSLLTGTYNIDISGTATNSTQLGGQPASNFMSSANKAVIGDSQAGTDDTKWMSPLQSWNAFKTLGLGEQLINLTQNVDLNTLRGTGTRWYYVPSTATNLPVASTAGYLLIEEISSSYAKQTFTVMSGAAQATMYTRTYVSGTWSGWNQIAETSDNVASAAKWQTARTLSFTGDATGSMSVDGSANASAALTLAASGVTAGTYTKVTVDAKGRVTVGASLAAGDVPTLNQNTTGSAATLTTARTLSWTGDATGSLSFDGSANVSAALTLANSGVTAGTYAKVTVNAKGLVTGSSTLVAADIPALDASKITTGTLTVPTSGNAATATKLATARTLTYTGAATGSGSFDGSANVSIALTIQDSIALTGSPTATTAAATDSSTRIATTAQVASQIQAGGLNLTTNQPNWPATSLNDCTGASSGTYRTIATTTDYPSTVTHNIIHFWIRDAVTAGQFNAVQILENVQNGKQLMRVAFGTGTVAAPAWGSWNEFAYLTSNVASATKLATARTINGVAFDGTANITITSSLGPSGVTAGTYPKVTVDATGVVTAGTTLVAADIPALDASKITTGTLTVGTSGNAATATKLATSRTINGVAFDGTANITVADSTKVAKAGDTMSGELICTFANSYRMISGNYGSFWRNDGTTHYLMLTASGDQYGSWNTFRPLSVTLASGAVSIGAQGLTVPGAATFNSSITTVGDVIVKNGTAETHVVMGSTNGYLYGNSSTIGLYMPTGGANLNLNTSGGTNISGTLTVSGSGGFGNGLTVNSSASSLNGGTNTPWLELRANGATPFIDFSNDNSVDFDVRLILNSDNTLHLTGGNFYVDSTLYTGNWLRSIGNVGWYSESYGGGIYMTDTTWLRSYNGKSFYTAGEIAASGNVTAYYSDKRLKENLEPIVNALSTIKKWQGYRYNANELGGKYGYDVTKKEIGLLAQDVQATTPEVVARAPFDVDVEPNSSKSGEDYLTLRYERLVPILVEGVKEVDDILEATIDRVEKLESEVNELKALIHQLIQNKVG